MPRPSHATVVAYLALFVALGGSAYAGVTLSKNSVRSKHIRNGEVRSADVRNGSLRSADFAPGQLPAGPQGPRGETGAPGAKGDRGSDGAPGPAGATNVVVRTSEAVLDGNSSGVAYAHCKAGERATGGGGEVSQALDGAVIQKSLPAVNGGFASPGQTPTSWFVRAYNPESSNRQLVVYVVCAAP